MCEFAEKLLCQETNVSLSRSHFALLFGIFRLKIRGRGVHHSENIPEQILQCGILLNWVYYLANFFSNVYISHQCTPDRPDLILLNAA